jgi:hypothetical protein
MRLFDFERIVANRYNHLLVMLVIFFFCAPFFEEDERAMGARIITIGLLLTIIICLRATVASRKYYWLCVSIAVLALVLESLGSRSKVEDVRQSFITLSLLINCFFVSLTILFLMTNMFRAKKVTPDMIVGGISIYLLVGIMWSLIYILLTTFNEGAVQFTGEASMMYFSFTTLTTLGYGDIVPQSEFARVLTSLEAVFGQVYLAVFVARLVGLHIASEMKRI